MELEPQDRKELEKNLEDSLRRGTRPKGAGILLAAVKRVEEADKRGHSGRCRVTHEGTTYPSWP